MHQLAPGVHTAVRPLRFLGLEIGTRCTVLELPGGLLVHSPIDVAPASLAPLGTPTWALAPNKLHHLFVGPWVQAGVEGWAAPGLPEKRPDVPFAGVVRTGTHPFGPGVEVVTIESFPFSNEVVVFHEASRTLVTTDLVFHFQPSAPWLTRAAMWCLCGYPGCQASALERVAMRRDAARAELKTILGFDFDRLIMSHGDVIETGGREALAHAYRWLDVGPVPVVRRVR